MPHFILQMQLKKETKNTTELNNPCTCLRDCCGIDTKLSKSAIHFGKKSTPNTEEQEDNMHI